MSTSSAQASSCPTMVRYWVMGWLCLAAALSYLSRNCLGVVEEDISRELSLSQNQMAWIMSAFFITYGVFQIPAGWLGHRWGTRRALPLYAIVWSTITALMGLAGGFLSLTLARFAGGAAQAGIFPCCANTISHWMPTARRATACGVLASFMSVGGALAPAITGLLLHWQSWRWIFVTFSLPGILWAVWFYLRFRERPELHENVNQAELNLITQEDFSSDKETGSPAEENLPTPWPAIFSSLDMWFICGQQFFRAAGYIFFATWFPRFLKEVWQVSTEMSGYLTSLPLLAVVIGSPLGGILVDWIWNRTGSHRLSRQTVALASMVLAAFFFILAFFFDSAVISISLITVGSFCAALAGPCGYAVTIDKAGSHVATVFATMNMAGNIGAAICPLVVERIVYFSDNNWTVVLLFFAGVYLAAAICWAAINPSGTLFDPPQDTKENVNDTV